MTQGGPDTFPEAMHARMPCAFPAVAAPLWLARTVADLHFPDDFMWGAATAAHQVEGDNTFSDWWQWETAPEPKAPLAEPSGAACDHYRRYREDLRLLADLGLNTYRFSVEWARVEPSEGRLDPAALDHYADVVDTCLALGITPIVTLQHFTLPQWLQQDGGWLHPRMPERFARYAQIVVEELGDRVTYYCTINEPGGMIANGYLGLERWPPFRESYTDFRQAADNLVATHRRARDVIRETRPGAKVGMTHALQDWHADAGGEHLVRWFRHVLEDRYLEPCDEDDFIGVQTYTSIDVDLPRVLRRLARGATRSSTLVDKVVLPEIRRQSRRLAETGDPNAERRTQMGYAYAPAAVEATTRRVAERFPGTELLITEHGIGTDDDTERVDYIREGLAAVHRMIEAGLPVTAYVHWSLLDNFEWNLGYRPTFGLVAVDRGTQARTVKPSARFLGDVARTGTLTI